MSATLDNLEVLKTAESLADEIWQGVGKWDGFAKDTVGKQLVRATDSVGANIAEAFGRYHYGEKLQFLYYARGSVYEMKYWLNRVQKRQLMPANNVQHYLNKIGLLSRQLNGFLAYIKRLRQNGTLPKTNTLREVSIEYEITQLEFTDLFTHEEITFLETLD
jgi:four helix bundle protein